MISSFIGFIWFVLKVGVFTVAVVMLLQLQVGGKSVDGHLSHWMKKHKFDQKAQKIISTHTQFARRALSKGAENAQSKVNDSKKSL